jgi:hypothetical protein
MVKTKFMLRAKQGGGLTEVVIEAATTSMAELMAESQYGSSFYVTRIAG